MAQTLFIELKRLNPNANIDVLAPAWTRPLLERMPEVRDALAMELGHGEVKLSARKELGRSLIPNDYDQSIVLPNSLKSALVPFWAKIPKRTGWRGEMRYGLLNDLRKLDKAKYPLMIERFIALAHPKNSPLPSPLPVPKLEISSASRNSALGKFKLDTDTRPVLALCPGAEFGESKRWPADHYGEVARQKIGEGWQVWIFGSANDREVANTIVCGLSEEDKKHCYQLAGETSLAEAVDLLSCAKLAITNDSGLMHIAAALSVPLIAVYGSTSPDFTPPLGEHSQVIKSELDCAPCFERECPLGHGNCMKGISSETVLRLIDRA